MLEERDYHLKEKDYIPFVGWRKYHKWSGDILIDESPFNKNFWHIFSRECGLVVYNALLFCSATFATNVVVHSIDKLVEKF
jgi:hypothetical protein